MAQYMVEQTRTSTILWMGEATHPADALERMARAAGYTTYAEACEASANGGEGIIVKELHYNKFQRIGKGE